MSIATEPFAPPNAAALSLRYALRELRGGLRGFYVFIACIALGVMAIVGRRSHTDSETIELLSAVHRIADEAA